MVLDARVAKQLPFNDSKQLTASQRQRLRAEIEAKAITWSVAFVSPSRDRRMNILQASFEAMRNAVRGLAGVPDHLLIDGNRFVSDEDMPPHTCFVKGDAKIASIAAASILAKTHRDTYMLDAAQTYPGYGWETNMGYPHEGHRASFGGKRSDPLAPKNLHLGATGPHAV